MPSIWLSAARTASSRSFSSVRRLPIRCASASLSVSLANTTPSDSKRARSSAAFSTMPLWTTATHPLESTCGWAFTSLGSPCVAQRVWPMPTLPDSRFGSAPSSSRSLPSRLCTFRSPARLTSAMPAES